ncbi:hypothetical protein LJC64_01910 [Ruminococcaceae bacterium OttesenSCG-928-A11]|nr:hypothetical protein [Ruminococcaceae bacterium OttesenSCG-928-A11]
MEQNITFLVLLDYKKLDKNFVEETSAYAVTDSMVGAILGLLLHRFFFGILITSNWGQLWHPPIAVLTVTITAAALTTFVAVIYPARKIEQMGIVGIVNAG